MAERITNRIWRNNDGSDDLSEAFCTLSVDNDSLKKLELDDKVRSRLNEIENDFESIFSWKIKQLTGNNQCLLLDIVEKCRDQCELTGDTDGSAGTFERFFLQLIISYEYHVNGDYRKSLLEIENVIKSFELCIFDEANKQYSDVWNHIARVTKEYIALSLNLDVDKVVKRNFNQVERAAINALKAKIFMEYAPKGNDLALEFVDQALTVCPNKIEWLIIWMKAKGRVRRFYNNHNIPDQCEIDNANILSKEKTFIQPLITAGNLYMEVALNLKYKCMHEESKRYYLLAFDLITEAIELTDNDPYNLFSCLVVGVSCPKELQSRINLRSLVEKMEKFKNRRVDNILGKYYFQWEKNYEKAKMYLSRAMYAGYFSSAMTLLRNECQLKPPNEFPYVENLNMMYEIFPSPRRRLSILSCILLYYFDYDDNPKELMHYLKLYMEQEIDNKIKKRILVSAYPMYKPKTNRFMYKLAIKLETIQSDFNWSIEERKNNEETLKQFNNMNKIKVFDNQVSVNNTTCFQNKEYTNSLYKRYPNAELHNNRNNKSSWRKKQTN